MHAKAGKGKEEKDWENQDSGSILKKKRAKNANFPKNRGPWERVFENRRKQGFVL